MSDNNRRKLTRRLAIFLIGLVCCILVAPLWGWLAWEQSVILLTVLTIISAKLLLPEIL